MLLQTGRKQDAEYTEQCDSIAPSPTANAGAEKAAAQTGSIGPANESGRSCKPASSFRESEFRTVHRRHVASEFAPHREMRRPPAPRDIMLQLKYETQLSLASPPHSMASTKAIGLLAAFKGYLHVGVRAVRLIVRKEPSEISARYVADWEDAAMRSTDLSPVPLLHVLAALYRRGVVLGLISAARIDDAKATLTGVLDCGRHAVSHGRALIRRRRVSVFAPLPPGLVKRVRDLLREFAALPYGANDLQTLLLAYAANSDVPNVFEVLENLREKHRAQPACDAVLPILEQAGCTVGVQAVRTYKVAFLEPLASRKPCLRAADVPKTMELLVMLEAAGTVDMRRMFEIALERFQQPGLPTGVEVVIRQQHGVRVVQARDGIVPAESPPMTPVDGSPDELAFRLPLATAGSSAAMQDLDDPSTAPEDLVLDEFIAAGSATSRARWRWRSALWSAGIC
ncbi:hypothetical protein DFH09DRAFT_1072518 [Mycena vulgaris]|nr:hypothetical protein DFH09DRAFT_1072518 [Mycena vulgaris]